MERSKTYYEKIGRKYIPIDRFNMEGFGEGLWLITRDKYSIGTRNVLYAVKTHNLQDVGKFADFYKAHKDKLQDLVAKEYEAFIKEKTDKKEGFSISDLTDCMIAALSKID